VSSILPCDGTIASKWLVWKTL